MATASEAAAGALRPRRCLGPDCHVVFMVCGPCYRGQRYCSQPCRSGARQRQRREANRRYQKTEPGREAYRCRQRAYRARQTGARVTDQALRTITPTPSMSLTHRPGCAICGCQSRWIDPFAPLPFRAPARHRGRMVGARPKKLRFQVIANTLEGTRVNRELLGRHRSRP
jgi:hypothetical protein